MSLFNVEFFSDHFEYKDSMQVSDKGEYENDYLSVTVNKIDLPAIDLNVSQGDYIRITGNDLEISGIITGVTDKATYTQVEYKSFLNILDVDVHYNGSRLAHVPLEQWLAEIIRDTFVENADTSQNVYGMSVTYDNRTNDALMDLDSNIGNLYEILQKALINYGVTARFSICVAQKTLLVRISAATAELLYIEADLPNILRKQFNFKKSGTAYNKLIVYNELDEAESLIFYLETGGRITIKPDPAKRITPVVFSTVYVKHEADDNRTFYDMGYDKAYNKLNAEKYDNLIELETELRDGLVRPLALQIGQHVAIIREGTVYETILTGIRIGNTATLMFGTVRLELTKKLKRRMQG